MNIISVKTACSVCVRTMYLYVPTTLVLVCAIIKKFLLIWRS